ncbi:hypothetical protein, partial [Acetivibrio sp. MSJd-27]|uniref:hypothetical protein n=1 Tax=Acetivibrio sp. MSJd-27 TaxID=2841523 RepID=UPI001C125D5F
MSATDFNGNTVTTAYNKLNKETEVVTPMEENVTAKVNYFYDNLGREHAIYMEEPGSGYQKMKQTDYDLFSRPIKISLFAESETTPSGVMEYTYYADSSPKSETAKEGSKVLSKKDYA